MKTIKTDISWGYLPLLEIFAKANSLVLKFDSYDAENPIRQLTEISYEEDSDTAYSVTLMSTRNLGFENMLWDYLKRCNIPIEKITTGKIVMRKSDEQMEKEWQEHRKNIGLV